MKRRKSIWTACAVLLLSGLAAVSATPAPRARGTSSKPQQHNAGASKTEPPSPDKVLRFVRERFGLVSTVKLTIGSLDPSPDPEYYQTVVTADDGKQNRQTPLSISKDGKYLITGGLVPIGPDTSNQVLQAVREQLKVPANVKLTTGPFRPSRFPGFLETTMTANDGTHPSQDRNFSVTADKKFLVLGEVYPMTADPRREALRLISLKDQPTQGPAGAPVTIVEYADLECPSCAAMHKFLEDSLLPKYDGKVRVVFKEFPLATIHQWAATAAMANECAYQLDPSKFVTYRTMIFQKQNDIDAVQANSSQVRDLLLGLGQQAGLDRAKLAVCLDSQASKPRVDAGRKEGDALNVNQTPTFYINGKILIGGPPPEMFYQAIDDALKETHSAS